MWGRTDKETDEGNRLETDTPTNYRSCPSGVSGDMIDTDGTSSYSVQKIIGSFLLLK